MGLILIAYDITERKRTQDYITHLAHHDALTGLPVRTLLHDRLEDALARARRQRSKVGLLVIDLDNFKRINDSMGHAAGDQLLMEVAERLRHWVRVTDTVARMGGDEFVVVLDGLHNAEEAESIAHKLLAALRAPIRIEGKTLLHTASIGGCLYPDQATCAEDLLRYADVAMYRVKAEGRDGYGICDSMTYK